MGSFLAIVEILVCRTFVRFPSLKAASPRPTQNLPFQNNPLSPEN